MVLAEWDSTRSFGFLIILVAAVLLWFVLVFHVAKYAEGKGQSFVAFLALGLFTGPLISFIAALVVGRTGLTESSAAAPSSQVDTLDQLKKLGDLRDRGVLTASEFDAKKSELLSRS